MRTVKPWEDYFFDLAILAASRSKDPSTQVGCVLVSEDKDIVSTGYNGFAPGVNESEELWERPAKYGRVLHAELNAVSRAARRGVATGGCTAYVTHHPCDQCTKTLIAAGISSIVCGGTLKGWDESHNLARTLAEEAGVSIRLKAYPRHTGRITLQPYFKV